MVVAVWLRWPLKQLLVSRALGVLAGAGIVVVVISGTPQPVWLYALWLISAVIGLYILNRPRLRPRHKWHCAVAVGVGTAMLVLAETPYHQRPVVGVAPDTPIYVLGDSISAGTECDAKAWPAVLDGMLPNPVTNLAVWGTSAAGAMKQARQIDRPSALVIVEIGGIDLISRHASATFRKDYDALLAALHHAGHKLLLIEIPLFPFTNGYGQAQRELAKKYNAALIPKRHFARVLSLPDATLDDLHLSQRGHLAMATMVAKSISVTSPGQ